MAAFSPDGQRVITGGQDDVARLWKTDGTPVASLEGHTDVVNWAAFSPDGRLIATASTDGSVRLWTMDGNFLAKVEGHTQGVTCASFSPDGIYLVTASRDGTARLWSIFENLDAMLLEAAQRVGRMLTNSECQRYLHTETCIPKK
jgi:WD40 repeat protein